MPLSRNVRRPGPREGTHRSYSALHLPPARAAHRLLPVTWLAEEWTARITVRPAGSDVRLRVMFKYPAT